MHAPSGEGGTDSGVVQLACDRDGDPGRLSLARALNAEFAVEIAVRRRRAWTAALALMGVPATLSLVFPGLLTSALRRTEVAAWSVAALALAANLLGELRAARAARQLRHQLRMPGPRSGGGMR